MKPEKRPSTESYRGYLAEKPEPVEDRTPVPVLFILIFALLFFGAQLYLDRYAGGFRAEVFAPFTSFKEVENANPVSPELKFYRKGAQVFNAMCAQCHQSSGLGSPGQFPPLAGSEWVLAEGPNRLVRIVLHGLQGPIKVKGADWNFAMPNVGGSLTDEDLAALLTFIRQQKDWGHNASAVTVEEVKAIREAAGNRNQPWTGPELLGIPAK